MTIRESFLTIPDHVVAAPGPGQYDIASNSKVKGGSTVGNRGIRFENEQNLVPGPGSYNVAKATDWVKNEPEFGLFVREVALLP